MIKNLLTKAFSFSFLLFTTTTFSQKAIQFDGTDDEINFGNSPLFNITDSLTVEAKIKVSGAINYPTFISNFEDSTGFWKGYWLGGDNTGKATWYIGSITTPSTGYYLNSSSLVNDGNWHHLSGVFFGDSAKLYIDGVLETFSNVPNPHPYSTYSLIAGNDMLGDLYGGAIDDIRIWNTVRSGAQIALYKDSCLKGNEPNLVALYHFERGVNGSIAYDRTANGLNGKLTNMDTLNVWVAGTNCTACKVYPINKTVTQNTFTLSSNQSGATYRWLDCANSYSFITGATGQSYTVTMNGNYAVEVSRYNCVDTSNCINIMNVGIIENNLAKSIKLYPNPASNQLNIQLAEKEAAAIVKVFDLTGKLILSKEFNQTEKIRMDLSLTKGLYLVELNASNKKSVFKLNIE
ncbi:MAG: LamG-like jellyroll fold domain-containing protein [Bacteroidia bacterium]